MKIVFLAGRVLAGGYYIYSGLNHFLHHSGMAGYAKMKGVPMPEIAVPATGALLVIGGLCLLLGYRPWIGVAALTLFLVPVTFVMHDWWAETDPARSSDLVNFTKNLALLGSAWMFLKIPTPWPASLKKR